MQLVIVFCVSWTRAAELEFPRCTSRKDLPYVLSRSSSSAIRLAGVESPKLEPLVLTGHRRVPDLLRIVR
jgi:hypothetical protein